MKKLIYAADDEAHIRTLIAHFLEDAGYEARTFETGDLLYEAFIKKPADLVILDIMMPGTDGLAICARLRAISRVPIIILTARESETDYIMGISIGGDDYLNKPFRPSILAMRVKALLRRVDMEEEALKEAKQAEVLMFEDLQYIPLERRIMCAHQELPLTSLELALLRHLMARPGKACSREELLSDVWGIEAEVETRVTDETVRRLRKKLSLMKSRVQIKTIWGFGYRLEKEDLR